MLEAIPLTGTVRLLPPVSAGSTASIYAGANPITVPGGRVYAAAVGAAIDVPAADAVILINNGWSAFCWGSGPTSARPAPGINLVPGTMWLDTTLNIAIMWDGATWRNYAGTAV